jgi:3-(3-hydroxy-phenyl)propionate hydroxylase
VLQPTPRCKSLVKAPELTLATFVVGSGAEAQIRVADAAVAPAHVRFDWRAGRLFIAGDAAHLNNPKGGMGMNGGIHDAICLSQALVRALNSAPGSAPDAVLDAYERQRLPVVRDDIIGQADRNHARMQLRSLDERRASLAQLQALIDDRDRLRKHLRNTSMLDGLERARQLAQA